MTPSRLAELKGRFDAHNRESPRWKKRNAFFYGEVARIMRLVVPEGARVLEAGSGDGSLLESLNPAEGVGIDLSGVAVSASRKSHPHLCFFQEPAETYVSDKPFDYIILANLVGYLDDAEAVFENLQKSSSASTRLVIQYYNFVWEPVLWLADRLGLRMRQGVQNWLSMDDLENLLYLTGYQTVRRFRKILFPLRVPLVSAFFNRVVANLPLINHLCLAEFIVARPLRARAAHPSVSVVVACKDERGNIEELVRRVPSFGAETEIVFVDGHSTDGTPEEIRRVAALHPEKNIRLLDQGDTRGKGAAIRAGFENARHKALIILDADISVAPEDLVKFYRRLADGRGELINGSRLVYPMEKEAMRFFNLLGNKFFSAAFSFLLDQRLKDTLCGTKALLKSDYEKIAKNRAYFGDFDPFGDFDLLFGAAKLNLKIVDLPVRYYERHYGEVKIRRWRHGTLLLGMCLVALKRIKFV